MPKKGREPAGLRRYRLAHRKRKKSRRSGRPSRGKKSYVRHAPGLGASYLNASRGLALASPLVDAGIDAARSKALPSAEMVKDRLWNASYAGAVGMVMADAYVDAKLGQSAAISRGSATAILPEVFRGLATARGGRDPASLNASFTRTAYGYDPSGGSAWGDPDFLTYRVLKHGGQAVRYAVNRTEMGKRLSRPLKKAMGAVGVGV